MAGAASAPTPRPPARAATQTQLEGVTCTGASNCWAAGFHTTTTGTAGLIEHWNGTKWSITAS